MPLLASFQRPSGDSLGIQRSGSSVKRFCNTIQHTDLGELMPVFLQEVPQPSRRKAALQAPPSHSKPEGEGV